uniref:Myosin-XVIIIa n=1 Tax=Ascaris suum TaxID=6253 RepID=F1L3B2_ASCSU
MFLVRKKEKDDRKEEKKKKNTLLVASLKDDAEPLVSSSVTVVLSAANVQPATEFHQARPNESERTPQQFGTSEQWFRDAMSSHNKETNSQNGSVTFQSFPVLKDLPKLSLPALAPVQVNQRTLTLHRNVAGDFGFNVRRTQFPDFRGRLRAVVFAEPTEVRCGPPRPSDIRAGLLPGDQLVKMNGRSVESLGREELLAIIQNSGDQVELTVRAMPELAELCDRTQRGVRDTGDSLMLPPVSNTYLDENITEDERYWLMHKNGCTMARMIETQSDGKVHVMVAGAEMVVDVTDVDKANPSNMDRVEDLARLRYINETSAVHVLRHRYGSGLLYTNAGALSIICMANEQEPLLCNKLVALFKGCRRQQMPPHIYASAQQAYRKMQMSGRSQCLILTGVTGSGKSTQLRNVCHYLCEIAGWTKSLSCTYLVRHCLFLCALSSCFFISTNRTLLIITHDFSLAASFLSFLSVSGIRNHQRAP